MKIRENKGLSVSGAAGRKFFFDGEKFRDNTKSDIRNQRKRHITTTITITTTTMKLLSSSIRSACSFLVAAVIVIVTTITTTTAAPEADAVVSYPGFGPPPTPHYSGYLDASAGCDTDKNGPECQLHYMLAMAEDVDSTRDEAAPTIVWFNGGPAWYVTFFFSFLYLFKYLSKRRSILFMPNVPSSGFVCLFFFFCRY